VISARGREADKVEALDAGADDYLTKPFGTAELMARIRVALRHAQTSQAATPEPVITVGPCASDLAARIVTKNDRELHLHADRVSPARPARQERRARAHAPTDPAGGLGPPHAGETHYVRVYMGELAQEDRRRPGPSEAARDRTRRGVIDCARVSETRSPVTGAVPANCTAWMFQLPSLRRLRTVIDPEVGMNIVDLGLVYGLDLEGHDLTVRLTMTTPACPLSEYLGDLATRAIRAAHPDLTSVSIAWCGIRRDTGAHERRRSPRTRMGRLTR